MINDDSRPFHCGQPPVVGSRPLLSDELAPARDAWSPPSSCLFGTRTSRCHRVPSFTPSPGPRETASGRTGRPGWEYLTLQDHPFFSGGTCDLYDSISQQRRLKSLITCRLESDPKILHPVVFFKFFPQGRFGAVVLPTPVAAHSHQASSDHLLSRSPQPGSGECKEDVARSRAVENARRT